MNFDEHTWQESAWRRIRHTLFCEETGLVYDYVTSRDHSRRFAHLPSPEEIALGFPNPCGWSTGMEDCALNGGFLLDLLRFRREEDSDFARLAAEGLIRCAEVHGMPGFVARGISPRDGRSCYGNSSRDQFTLATYGMWRFLSGGGVIPERLRQRGVTFLRSVADYCERIVTPANACNLMRLDGRPAIVSTMWNCAPHEALRLPMIYGIAASVTGEPRYYELMRRYAAAGLRETLTMNPEADWWDMPVIQMQLSLNFFAESGIAPELESGVRRAMHTAAAIACPRLLALLREAEEFDGDWGMLYDNWRRLPMKVTPVTLAPDGGSALFGGKSYLNPVFRDEYARPNALLRGIGNYLATIAHSDDFPFPETLLERTARLLRRIDFSRCAGVGILPLLYGYTAVTYHKFQLQGEEA